MGLHLCQQQKTSGTDKGTGTILGVPDVPIYEYESEKESWGDSDEEDDDEDDFDDDSDDNDESDDERMKSDRDEIPDPNKTNEEHNEEEEYDDEFNIKEEEKIDDEESMDEEEDDEVTKELYDDVNVNLGNKDADMTDADQGGRDQQNISQQSGFEGLTQSSYVSTNFTNKLLNLDNPSPANNEIASLMDTAAQYATIILVITSSFTTTVPLPPLFFNPLQQEATPTPTPTTLETTTSLPALPDFSSVFKFNERVFNLEKDVSKIKQVDQYAQALSFIPAIVNFGEYIELVDSMVRIIIKEEVNAQLPQILPQAISYVATPVIEKNVTESVESVVLTRSSSQPTSTYEAAHSLMKSYNTDKDLFDSYSEVFSLKRSRDEKDKDRDPSAGSDRGTKRRKSSKDADSSRDLRSQVILLKTQKPERPPTPDPDWSKRQQIDFRPPQTGISQDARAEEPPTSFDAQ
ncbi:hypothetical protein Tco_0755369 [Tanacetum coccineum]